MIDNKKEIDMLDCWLDISGDSDFSIHNLPVGVYKTKVDQTWRIGVAIGDYIINMKALSENGLLRHFDFDTSVFTQNSLNEYIALGKKTTDAVRLNLQSLLSEEDSPLKGIADSVLDNRLEAEMKMPLVIGDYTDFYSSIEHATNVGKLFRDPENALLPNWKHLPVGYHGRASSIIGSGIDIVRPQGQVFNNNFNAPQFQPTRRLDFELEMAFVIGKDSTMGKPVPTSECGDYIFGMAIFNDWSARDIQKWEYVPLGPFLGKSFASSISPWIVPLSALDPFRVDGPVQDPKVLPYLEYNGKQNYDIHLEVDLETETTPSQTICRSNTKYLYWNMLQQLAHHTSNGCNIKVGDLMATGTISGKDENSYGSLLEMTYGGKKPIVLGEGVERKFVEDGDRITMRAFAQKDGIKVGFGEVTNKILPAYV